MLARRDRLGVLREDRNLCDYDHTAKLTDLVVGANDASVLVQQFLKHAQGYLRRRGIKI